jgi:cell division initiation protein
MRVTPLDIIQKKFSPARRSGYDSDEVQTFLEEVRESMEEMLKENQRLREEIGRRESEIQDLKGNETDIKHTLQLARRLGEDLERGARREADVIVGEARLEAERVLMAAAEERRELQAEIVRLRSNRMRMMAEMRAVVDGYGRIIDDMEQEAPAAR